MKPMLVALVLSGVAPEHSLEIGLDVLPEAFTFAAHRVGFNPTLRLARCTHAECLWDIGQGVEMAAVHRQDSVALDRIEVKLRLVPPIATETLRHYKQACLTVVTLVYREGNAAETEATAKAIADSEPGAELVLPESNIRLYGTRSASMTQSKQDVVLRCGAMVGS